MKKSNYKVQKTESISLRIDRDLKKQIFELLESQDKTFSKWLRNQIVKYIEKNGGKNE